MPSSCEITDELAALQKEKDGFLKTYVVKISFCKATLCSISLIYFDIWQFIYVIQLGSKNFSKVLLHNLEIFEVCNLVNIIASLLVILCYNPCYCKSVCNHDRCILLASEISFFEI